MGGCEGGKGCVEEGGVCRGERGGVTEVDVRVGV